MHGLAPSSVASSAPAPAPASAFTTILDSQSLDDVDFESDGPGTGTLSNGLAYEYEDLGGSGAAVCNLTSGVFNLADDGSGNYSALHIDLGADTADDAVFVCAKVTMGEASPGNGVVVFMLGDGTADVNPTGAFQHVTWSTTSVRTRFANSSGFTYFSEKAVTAADGEAYLVRMTSVGTGGWAESYDGSTRPSPTDAKDASRESGGRSSTSDNRRFLTILANLACSLDIVVARQSEAP
jgi:hypothetical protein